MVNDLMPNVQIKYIDIISDKLWILYLIDIISVMNWFQETNDGEKPPAVAEPECEAKIYMREIICFPGDKVCIISLQDTSYLSILYLS